MGCFSEASMKFGRNSTTEKSGANHDMNQGRIVRKVLLIALKITGAFVIPVFISIVAPDITKSERFLLGIMVLVAANTIEILYMADMAFFQARQFQKLWEASEALDAELHEVRRLFHIIGEERHSEDDLFYSYFRRKLSDLASSLRDATTKREILINETMMDVTTWLYKSSFFGRPNDVFRAVYLSEDEDFFFDVHVHRYFQQVYSLIQQGKAKGVRRLIVYDNDQALSTPRMQRLIAFHNDTPHYECKVISKPDFQLIIRDYQLHYLLKDFGIYGDSYLYKGLTNRKEEIVGMYSRNPVDIKRFTNCFEAAWLAARQAQDSEAQLHTGDVEWLFSDPVGQGQPAAVKPPPREPNGTQTIPLTEKGTR
jgi:hypothetical protein